MPQAIGPQLLSVGESVGGASGAGPLYTDANGLLIDPGTAPTLGTFTPTIVPDTLGDWAPTYTTQTGSYLQIGRLVMIGFHVAGTTNAYSTAAGTLSISGFTQTVNNSAALNGVGGLTNVTGLDTSSASHDGWTPYGRSNLSKISFTRQAKGSNPAGSASASVTQLPASRTFDIRGICFIVTT